LAAFYVVFKGTKAFFYFNVSAHGSARAPAGGEDRVLPSKHIL
jgi:hypothetical protein